MLLQSAPRGSRLINMNDYVILCAPSGTGFREAKAKLAAELRIGNKDVIDLEDCLTALPETIQALGAAGYHRPRKKSKWPTMHDVTFKLPRDTVAELWKKAAKTALDKLKRSKASTKVLGCHLLYYGGQRQQLYSPVNISALAGNKFKPTHILLLIDDIYDMFWRLTREGELYESAGNVRDHFNFLGEYGKDTQDWTNLERVRFSFSWQLSIMSHLLSWRHSEFLIADQLAMQLGSRMLAWGVKQSRQAAATWLKSKRPTVYLSHSISELRRHEVKWHKWLPIVREINQIQNALIRHSVVSVMPTSIDEFRLQRQKFDKARPTALPEPILSRRWPLPDKVENLLYSVPERARGPNHKLVFEPVKWNPKSAQYGRATVSSRALAPEVRSMLELFERQLALQVAVRDHFFVSRCGFILIYRPYYKTTEFSGGVGAELRHWLELAKSDANRRALLIHVKSDIEKLLNSKDNLQDLRELWYKEAERETGTDRRALESLLEKFNARHKNIIHDPAPSSEVTELKRILPTLNQNVVKQWLQQLLRGLELGLLKNDYQVGLMVLARSADMQPSLGKIAGFFTGARKRWHVVPDFVDSLVKSKATILIERCGLYKT